MDKDLTNWVKYIGNQSVPVFNQTIQSVIKLTNDDGSTNKELAEIILQDASLTSRVIRVANSPYYNRCNHQSNDLRRIILLIGFKRITEICLTISVLDSLIDKRTRTIVYKIISKSFHAAIQARSIAELYRINKPDRIYLAALLNNIGEISFWSLSGKAGRLIYDLINNENIDSEEAQQNILGTTFKEMSLRLATEWQFSNLLKNSLLNPTSSDVEIKSIHYGYEIAESILNKNSDFKDVSIKIANETKKPINDIQTIINNNILLAHDTYNYYLNI